MDRKKVLITFITLVLIVIIAAVAVFLTKGYSFSSGSRTLVGSGIISVKSLPTGASVYLDGHLVDATDTNINNLSPKSYQVKIIKEGFITWEKVIEVKEGLVSEIKALLFPSIPTVYPLTFNGVVNPLLSPDGTQLAFSVPIATDSATTSTKQRGGIWIYTLEQTPIAIARGAQPHQVLASISSLDLTKATLRFSPDSKQLLVRMGESYYLITDLGSLNTLKDVTPQVQSITKGWDDDQKAKDLARIESLKDLEVRNIASASASPTGLRTQEVKWSPDETKLLVINSTITPPKVGISPTPASLSKAQIYDLGTSDKLFDKATKYELPEAYSYQWLPDSRHVIMVTESGISIIEFDGNNNSVVYAGNFDKKAVFPWPDSSKLMIVSSLPTPTASTPNLFGINLK